VVTVDQNTQKSPPKVDDAVLKDAIACVIKDRTII